MVINMHVIISQGVYLGSDLVPYDPFTISKTWIFSSLNEGDDVRIASLITGSLLHFDP
jgi:hypothetical protein